MAIKGNIMPMDRIDRAVLRALEEDARLSYAELGERVGLSKSSCWKRVQALEAAGVIEGYGARLSPTALGLDLHAFVQVQIAFAQHEAFEAAVRRQPAILSCHATTGDADYLLQVMARSMADLDQLLRRDLWRLPGVQRFTTTMVTRAIKAHAPLMAVVED